MSVEFEVSLQRAADKAQDELRQRLYFAQVTIHKLTQERDEAISKIKHLENQLARIRSGEKNERC